MEETMNNEFFVGIKKGNNFKNDFYSKGRMLLKIKKENLYKASGKGFTEFCISELGLGRTTVYQYIKASRVVDLLKNSGFTVLPQNEYQARLLSKFKEQDILKIWQTVLLKNMSAKGIADSLIQNVIMELGFKVNVANKVNKPTPEINISDKYVDKAEYNRIVNKHNEHLKQAKELVKELKMYKQAIKDLQKTSWHEILEIPQNSDIAEIKKAHRNLVSEFHPDKFSAIPELTNRHKNLFNKKTVEINNAYDKAKAINKFK